MPLIPCTKIWTVSCDALEKGQSEKLRGYKVFFLRISELIVDDTSIIIQCINSTPGRGHFLKYVQLDNWKWHLHPATLINFKLHTEEERKAIQWIKDKEFNSKNVYNALCFTFSAFLFHRKSVKEWAQWKGERKSHLNEGEKFSAWRSWKMRKIISVEGKKFIWINSP